MGSYRTLVIYALHITKYWNARHIVRYVDGDTGSQIELRGSWAVSWLGCSVDEDSKFEFDAIIWSFSDLHYPSDMSDDSSVNNGGNCAHNWNHEYEWMRWLRIASIPG